MKACVAIIDQRANTPKAVREAVLNLFDNRIATQAVRQFRNILNLYLPIDRHAYFSGKIAIDAVPTNKSKVTKPHPSPAPPS